MKKLYINGKIYVDKEHFEESMLISDGIIVALGTNEELMKHEADEIVLQCRCSQCSLTRDARAVLTKAGYQF